MFHAPWDEDMWEEGQFGPVFIIHQPDIAKCELREPPGPYATLNDEALTWMMGPKPRFDGLDDRTDPYFMAGMDIEIAKTWREYVGDDEETRDMLAAMAKDHGCTDGLSEAAQQRLEIANWPVAVGEQRENLPKIP